MAITTSDLTKDYPADMAWCDYCIDWMPSFITSGGPFCILCTV